MNYLLKGKVIKMFKKLLTTAAVLLSATALACSAGATSAETEEREITIGNEVCEVVDFYFEDFATGEKNYSPLYCTNNEFLFLGGLSRYAFYDSNDNALTNPYDKMHFGVKIHSDASDYSYGWYGDWIAGGGVGFTIGTADLPINNSYYLCEAERVYRRMYSLFNGLDDVDKSLDYLTQTRFNQYRLRTENVLPNKLFTVSFPLSVKNVEENSIEATIKQVACTDDYDNAYYPLTLDDAGITTTSSYAAAKNSSDVLAMVQGDKCKLTPYVNFEKKIAAVDTPIEVCTAIDSTGKSVSASTKRLDELDDDLGYAITLDGNEYSNDYCISYSSSNPSVVAVDGQNITAVGEGVAQITMNYTVSLKPENYWANSKVRTNKDCATFALFPALAIRADDLNGDGEIASEEEKTVSDNEYTVSATYTVQVYGTEQNADISLDDTPLSEILKMSDNYDFAVASQEEIKINAAIGNQPYSAAVECDKAKIKTTDGQLGSQSYITFDSTDTGTSDVMFANTKKIVKIISVLGSYEAFSANSGYADELTKTIKDEGIFVRLEETESVVGYITDIMNEIAGTSNTGTDKEPQFGIPAFPKCLSLSIDNIDGTYLSQPDAYTINGKKSTLETIINVSLGKTEEVSEILDIKVIVSDKEPEFFLIPINDVSSYAELKKMSYDELVKLSIPADEYIVYSGTDLEVYAMEYPRVSSNVKTEILRGLDLASITPIDGVKNGYRLTPGDIGGYITLKTTGKDDNAKFRIKILKIESIALSPNQIVFEYGTTGSTASALAALSAGNSMDVNNQKAILDAMSTNEQKNKELTLYINDMAYDETVYYIVAGNQNIVTSEDWERLPDSGNGVHSDVFVASGPINVKISSTAGTCTIYAFPSSPDGSKTIDLITSGNIHWASSVITVRPTTGESTLSYDGEFVIGDSYEKDPFAELSPIYDAAGDLIGYYDYNIYPDDDDVSIEIFETKTILIHYDEVAVVPLVVNDITNGNMVTSNGTFSAQNAFAVTIYLNGNSSPMWSYAASSENIPIKGNGVVVDGEIMPYSDFSKYGYVCVWKKVNLPYTVNGSVLKQGKLSINGSGYSYISDDGKTYNTSEVKYGVVEASDAITVKSCSAADGKNYVTGVTAAGKTQKLEYTGQRVAFVINEAVKVQASMDERTTPPYTTSQNPSVASAKIGSYNDTWFQHTKSAFSVDITAEDYGKTTVDACGMLSKKCSINVTVPKATATGEDGIVEDTFIVTDRKGTLTYHLEAQKQVVIGVGETITIPLTATSSGHTMIYREITDPYKEVHVGGTKGICSGTLSGQNIVITGLGKGRASVNATGFCGCNIAITVIVQ